MRKGKNFTEVASKNLYKVKKLVSKNGRRNVKVLSLQVRQVKNLSAKTDLYESDEWNLRETTKWQRKCNIGDFAFSLSREQNKGGLRIDKSLIIKRFLQKTLNIYKKLRLSIAKNEKTSYDKREKKTCFLWWNTGFLDEKMR